MLVALKMRLSVAFIFSVALHAFALFGIALVLPDPRNATDYTQPLQVVLVNAKSRSRPSKADALAQANLDGGGNTTEDRLHLASVYMTQYILVCIILECITRLKRRIFGRTVLRLTNA